MGNPIFRNGQQVGTDPCIPEIQDIVDLIGILIRDLSQGLAEKRIDGSLSKEILDLIGSDVDRMILDGGGGENIEEKPSLGIDRDGYIKSKVDQIRSGFPLLSEEVNLQQQVSDLLVFSEKLNLLSGAIISLVVPRLSDGSISYECVQKISLKLSAVSGALSLVAFGHREEMIDTLRSHLKELLDEMFINC